MAYEYFDSCIVGSGTVVYDFWYDEETQLGYITSVLDDGTETKGEANRTLHSWRVFKEANTSNFFKGNEHWDYEGDEDLEAQAQEIEAQLENAKRSLAHLEAGIPDHIYKMQSDTCEICGLPYSEWG